MNIWLIPDQDGARQQFNTADSGSDLELVAYGAACSVVRIGISDQEHSIGGNRTVERGLVLGGHRCGRGQCYAAAPDGANPVPHGLVRDPGAWHCALVVSLEA